MSGSDDDGKNGDRDASTSNTSESTADPLALIRREIAVMKKLE